MSDDQIGKTISFDIKVRAGSKSNFPVKKIEKHLSKGFKKGWQLRNIEVGEPRARKRFEDFDQQIQTVTIRFLKNVAS